MSAGWPGVPLVLTKVSRGAGLHQLFTADAFLGDETAAGRTEGPRLHTQLAFHSSSAIFVALSKLSKLFIPQFPPWSMERNTRVLTLMVVKYWMRPCMFKRVAPCPAERKYSSSVRAVSIVTIGGIGAGQHMAFLVRLTLLLAAD